MQRIANTLKTFSRASDVAVEQEMTVSQSVSPILRSKPKHLKNDLMGFHKMCMNRQRLILRKMSHHLKKHLVATHSCSPQDE